MTTANTNLSFNILHADHGIAEAQMGHVKSLIASIIKGGRKGFFLETFQLPENLGTMPNGLYGPDCGDEPQLEGDVEYVQRGDRPWADRMVARPFRETRDGVMIGIIGENEVTVFTVYGGPVAPQHPDDPSNRDPEGAREWWSKHALATGVPKYSCEFWPDGEAGGVWVVRWLDHEDFDDAIFEEHRDAVAFMEKYAEEWPR